MAARFFEDLALLLDPLSVRLGRLAKCFGLLSSRGLVAQLGRARDAGVGKRGIAGIARLGLGV